MRILGLFIILSICSVDAFAEKKLKKSSADLKPTSVVDVAKFIKSCTSLVEIDEELAHKCAIDLFTNLGQEIFSQIKPNNSPQGKFEKSTEYDQRIAESLTKWNGLHVIFEKYDPEIRYNQDTEILLIHSDPVYIRTSNEIRTIVGGKSRNESTYEASNSFGKKVQVEKKDLLIYEISDSNYVDNLVDEIKFSLSIDEGLCCTNQF